MHRCNLYHEPRPDEDRPVKDALSELAGAWPTSGYRRLTAMLRREGLRVNEKRVRRLISLAENPRGKTIPNNKIGIVKSGPI